MKVLVIFRGVQYILILLLVKISMIIWVSVNIIRMLKGFNLLKLKLYKKILRGFGRDFSVNF